MQARHLDAFVRELSETATRRRALRLLSGGLALLLTPFGGDHAAAKPKKKCTKKKKFGQKCRKKNGATCPCKGGAKCKGTFCVCPEGTTEYLGKCLPGICRKNGLICDATSNCCSGHCAFHYNAFRCCIPNDEICPHDGVCCQTDSTPAACVNGRCCRELGAICDVVDSPLPPATCCPGTFCSSETFRCEPL